MATINNIQIKNLKEFRGHEGEPLYQGDIYYKGKKLGFWSQDFMSGSDTFLFNEAILQDEVSRCKAAYMDKSYPYNIEDLMAELLDLTLNEKEVKKILKQHDVAIVISDKEGYLTTTYGMNYPSESKYPKFVILNKFIAQAKKDFKADIEKSYGISISIEHYDDVSVKFYHKDTLDEFNVKIGY